MALPEALRQAVAALAADLPPHDLSALSARLSAAYRGGTPPPRLTPDLAAAYAAVRLPATFAAAQAALSQLRNRLPDWHPTSTVDVGAGPGTAVWAAAAVWPEIARATLLEREEAMVALGQRLQPPVPRTEWVQADLRTAWRADPADLVMASYVLGEVEDAANLVARLWGLTTGALVLIEPGTPAGFQRIRAARAHLVALGAHIAAPCPHGGDCPMAGGDWCHFAERVERSAAHRRAKGGALGYEDEKFSFVAAARLEPVPSAGRVLRHPQVRRGHVLLQACTPDGLQRLTRTRSDGERYRAARDLRWGSELR